MPDGYLLTLFGRIAAAIGWAILGVLVFWAGIRFYDRLDPIDYANEIAQGNVAAAIKLAAIIIGLAAIVVAAIVT